MDARVMSITVVAGIIMGGAGAQDVPIESPMLRKQTEELYWIMRRDGVISEAEYRRALQTGSISDPNQAQALREPGKSPPPQRSVRTGGTARIRTIIGNTLPARERPVPGGRVRTRFRTASRAYTNVLATIRECVRQQDAADVADALSRRRRAEAWAREHGVARRQIAPDGVISIIHDIDDFGIPRIMGDNALADAQFVKADELWPTATNGYALSGSNITVAVWETGQIRTTHGEFQGRATQVHTNEGFTSTDHATAMAGIIAAAGLDISYNVDGILYNGNVNGYDCEQANSQWDDVASEGKHVSNHAYGEYRGWQFTKSDNIWVRHVNPYVDASEDYLFGYYGGASRTHDARIHTVKYALPVWSAGNERGEGPPSQPTNWIYSFNQYVTNMTVHPLDGAVDNGYDTIPYEKTAKNALVVGAADVVTRDQYTIMAGSGWGPTDDGRLAPHVVAPGYSVIAPGSESDSDLTIMNGTSPACAIAAGVVAQLVQLDEQINGTNEPLWASTYKALVVHTAEKGSSYSIGPDYRQGYGLINARAAVDLLMTDSLYSAPQHVFEVVVATNQNIDTVVYSTGTNNLRATLCWTDPAGSDQPTTLDPTNRVLVHDLDLRISGPYDTVIGGTTGAVYYPWVLDPASPSSSATTNDNVLDNLEQVCVTNTQAGFYAIHVTLKPCTASGCSEQEQEASLIVSGNDPMEILPEITLLSVDTNGVRSLTWFSNAGVIEYIASSTNLFDTNGWSQVGDAVDVVGPLNEWSDTVHTNVSDAPRFYRVERHR